MSFLVFTKIGQNGLFPGISDVEAPNSTFQKLLLVIFSFS